MSEVLTRPAEKKPTEEQKAVIASPEKKVCVCAEAGSGKTSVLSGRYMRLVQLKMDPSRIACITFTRAAALEMRNRLERNPKFRDSAKKSHISTFHVLGKELIKKMPQYKGIKTQVLTEKHLEQIMPLDAFYPLSKAELIDFIQGAKEGLLTSQSDLTVYCKNEPKLAERQKLFQRAFAIYEEKMQELNKKGMFDMPDLVYIPTREMEKNENFRKSVQAMYDGILVDEFQDVNMMQATMLSLMCTDNTNVLIVGDDDQSIYGWRGAVSMMLQKQAAKWDAPIMKLSCNFRCPQPIVAVAECFVKNNVGRIEKDMQAIKTEGNKPFLQTSDSESDEIKQIVKTVKRWGDDRVKRGKERYGNEIAVLARNRLMVEKVRRALEAKGIETCSTTGNSNVAVKCDAIIKWALGEADERLFLSLSSDPICKEVLKNINVNNDIKAEIEERNLEASEPSPFIKSLLNVKKDTDFTAMVESFKEIDFFSIEEKKMLDESILPFCKGLNLEQTYEKLENTIISGNKGGQKSRGDLVTVSTIHGVKGLEYESVIVDMTFGVFGTKNRVISEEELRLAYVATTRAMKNLVYTADLSQGISPILTENVDGSLVTNLENYIVQREEFDFGNENPCKDKTMDFTEALWAPKEEAIENETQLSGNWNEKRPVFYHVPRSYTHFDSIPLVYDAKNKNESIKSLHDNFKKLHKDLNILEISTKSDSELGRSLSAFNLMVALKDGTKAPLESVFQASKVFSESGQNKDVLLMKPYVAKQYIKQFTNEEIMGFELDGEKFSNTPKTFFYNWLYVNALQANPSLAGQLKKYDAFTDIEFNPQKSINCQAEAASVYVALVKNGKLKEALSSKEAFKKIVYADTTRNVNSEKTIVNEITTNTKSSKSITD